MKLPYTHPYPKYEAYNNKKQILNTGATFSTGKSGMPGRICFSLSLSLSVSLPLFLHLSPSHCPSLMCTEVKLRCFF